MPFTLIKGKFKPLTGEPDGDSVRFFPDNKSLFKNLEGVPAKITTGNVPTKGSVQLRFEGIDAIEKAATKPLSVQAKDNMLKLIGFNKTTNKEPSGYILTRMTDPYGRPISFIFKGATALADGASVFLDATMLAKSVNYGQVKDGFAYPLYYNTLFAVLRNKFNVALKYAQTRNLGYWPSDLTNTGVTVSGPGSLDTIAPIWPKLWRRLEEYLRHNNSLANFEAFLDGKNERVIIIPTADETGLKDIVKVTGNQVRLTAKPKDIMVITVVTR